MDSWIGELALQLSDDNKVSFCILLLSIPLFLISAYFAEVKPENYTTISGFEKIIKMMATAVFIIIIVSVVIAGTLLLAYRTASEFDVDTAFTIFLTGAFCAVPSICKFIAIEGRKAIKSISQEFPFRMD